MIRLAIAGAGLIGRRHAEAIALAQGARLAAVIDPMPAGAELATAQGVPHFTDLSACFKAGGVDGVILATPNALHVEGGLACVEAGLPVLVEKPLDVDVGAARHLVEAGEAAGVAILTGHHRRYNPLISQAKDNIASGALGRILAVHASFWLIKPADYFAPEWRRAPGAGPVFLNLIHDLDLMRYLVGEVAQVSAFQSNAVRGNAVEDSCVVSLRFENGALGTATVSDAIPAPWSWEMTAAENPAYSATGQSCYQIGGTEGALELPSGRIWRHEGAQSWWAPIAATLAPRPAYDPLVAQIEHFARVIGAGEAPLVSGREGLKTLELIAAIKASAETGAPVSL